jgi:hypothetical protein
MPHCQDCNASLHYHFSYQREAIFMSKPISMGRAVWMIACVTACTSGGVLFGHTAGGVLGAVACGIGGFFVGLLIGASFLNFLDLIL